MKPEETPGKRPKAPVFFIIVLALSLIGLIKIIATGESSFRSARPYTMQSDPTNFLMDTALLLLFAVGALVAIFVNYSRKNDKNKE